MQAAVAARGKKEGQKHAEKWTPPIENNFKINTDASVREGEGTGIGVAIRDHRSQIITTLCHVYRTEYEIAIAETVACREGLILVPEKGLKNVVIESDNINLFHRLQNRIEDLSYMGNILSDIFHLFSCFDSVCPSFVRRTGNTVHHLASFAFSLDSSNPRIGDIPDHLEDLVVSDMVLS
ncbi:hypothetical protein DH2020_015463 [Rehmannia glutinosa]|uniref:RNase H type-1 domain-containing protein n=1 Tax=Rehmannia glutinosa TaxID=99300 RepID=A0ABR0WTA7_REHGL